MKQKPQRTKHEHRGHAQTRKQEQEHEKHRRTNEGKRENTDLNTQEQMKLGCTQRKDCHTN